jgi:pyridoxamine 5'-phosphate oxidase
MNKYNKILTGNSDLVNPEFDKPPSNPMQLLRTWLLKAEEFDVSEPRDLVLSTINPSNHPSSRVVLLTDIDETGVIFGTTITSNKGVDLQLNPVAAGTLWWRETMQQINFSGSVSRCSPEFSDRVFNERMRLARAATCVSESGQILVDEETLKTKLEQLMNSSDEIPRPAKWSAYHIKIEVIEFWHGSPDRLHKRLRYNLTENSWQYKRLQP